MNTHEALFVFYDNFLAPIIESCWIGLIDLARRGIGSNYDENCEYIRWVDMAQELSVALSTKQRKGPIHFLTTAQANSLHLERSFILANIPPTRHARTAWSVFKKHNKLREITVSDVMGFEINRHLQRGQWKWRACPIERNKGRIPCVFFKESIDYYRVFMLLMGRNEGTLVNIFSSDDERRSMAAVKDVDFLVEVVGRNFGRNWLDLAFELAFSSKLITNKQFNAKSRTWCSLVRYMGNHLPERSYYLIREFFFQFTWEFANLESVEMCNKKRRHY